MRSYFICPRDIAQTAGRHSASYHFHDLDNGMVLLSAEFVGDRQGRFERHASVETLPHLFDSSPIEARHVAHLQKHGVKAGHTTKDVQRIARETMCKLL